MSRNIITLIFCLSFITSCFADETKEVVAPAEPTEIAITNEERLTIENVQLKLQVLQGQLDSFVKQLVAKYKIDMQGWSYDATGGKFVKIKQPVKENLNEGKNWKLTPR